MKLELREYQYDTYREREKANSIMAEGIAFRLNYFLKANDLSEEDVEETYGNMSGFRNGNRMDIHEHYEIPDTTMEISFLYTVYGTVWAAVYDREIGKYVGELEVKAI